MSWFYPCTRPDAEEAARVLYTHVFTEWGYPRKIVSDRGSHFTARVLQRLNRYLGVTQVFTTAYAPNSNGSVETLNKRCAETIRKLSRGPYGRFWSVLLPHVKFALRAYVNTATGVPPLQLATGRPVNAPFTALLVPQYLSLIHI